MALYPHNYEQLVRDQLGVGVQDCCCYYEDVLGPGYPLMRMPVPYCLSCNDPVEVLMDVDLDAYDPDMQEDPPSEEDLQWLVQRWLNPPTTIPSRGW